MIPRSIYSSSLYAQVLENLKCNFSLVYIASQNLSSFSRSIDKTHFAIRSYFPHIPRQDLPTGAPPSAEIFFFPRDMEMLLNRH